MKELFRAYCKEHKDLRKKIVKHYLEQMKVKYLYIYDICKHVVVENNAKNHNWFDLVIHEDKYKIDKAYRLKRINYVERRILASNYYIFHFETKLYPLKRMRAEDIKNTVLSSDRFSIRLPEILFELESKNEIIEAFKYMVDLRHYMRLE